MTHEINTQKRREFTNAVKYRAAGNWVSILSGRSPQLDNAIGLWQQNKLTSHTFCPVHGGKHGDAFRALKDFGEKGGVVCNSCGTQTDGFQTLMWIYNYSFGRAVDEVAASLGMTRDAPSGYRQNVAPIAPQEPTAEEIQKLQDQQRKAAEQMRRVWQAAHSLRSAAADPAHRYFKTARGLPYEAVPHDRLRLHPAMKFMDGENTVGHFPTILAPFYHPDTQTNVSINRIFINRDGTKLKGYVSTKKPMMLAPGTTLSGSAIRLFEATQPVLAVAEGIETALSVRAAYLPYELPIWASTTAVLLENMILPPHIKLLLIFADKDYSRRGEQAAQKLTARCQALGITAYTLYPQDPVTAENSTVDWNDVWIKYGRAGFPDLAAIPAVAPRYGT